MLGVIVGWLNPIEGPLDWTYDEYASQPAHKYPTKVAPIEKTEEELPEWLLEADEDEVLTILKNLMPWKKEVGEE